MPKRGVFIAVYKGDAICHFGHAHGSSLACGRIGRYTLNDRPYCKRHALELVRKMDSRDDAMPVPTLVTTDLPAVDGRRFMRRIITGTHKEV